MDLRLALFDSQGVVCYLEKTPGGYVADFRGIDRLYTAAQLADVSVSISELNGEGGVPQMPSGRKL